MTEKLYRISIQITQDQYSKLKYFSRPGTSISALIRQFIEPELKKLEDNELGERAFEAAKEEEWEKHMMKKMEENGGLLPNDVPECNLDQLWPELQAK